MPKLSAGIRLGLTQFLCVHPSNYTRLTSNMNSIKSLLTFNLVRHKNVSTFVRSFSVKTENMQEQKIKVGDYQINYLKVGKGPHNVLLLPGALGSIWTDFAPQIKGLNKDLFTIVAWDPPGYGKSIPPNREFPVDFFQRDANTALLLMKALDLPKFSMLGWSDGGITSLILAAEYPKHVNKNVIWGANSHILPSEVKIYEGIKDVSKWSQKMRDPMIAVYGEKYFADTWAKWVDGIVNLYNAKKGDICMGQLQSVKCPTLIIHGEKDAMIHADHVPFLNNNIPNSKLHLFPEGKHNVHLRFADEFNKTVTEFLTS